MGVCAQARRLEECFSGLRGLAAKQIAYTLTPISFPYFHLKMLMIHVFLLLMEWNRSATGIGHTGIG